MRLIYLNQETLYEQATVLQEQAVEAILTGKGEETIFFCEHAPVYTCGTSADIQTDVLNIGNTPLIQTGRGGKVTYHGPGQRVIYTVLDLNTRGKDIRLHVRNLQKWMLLTLQELGLEGIITDDVGVWVRDPQDEKVKKIAAIGVRVRKWVTFHGVALNVCPDMEAFKRIVPCGIADKGVTSLQALGAEASLEDVDAVLRRTFGAVFGGALVE